ncbi:MAG: flippase [Solirubrobacteraceae bacterium]
MSDAAWTESAAAVDHDGMGRVARNVLALAGGQAVTWSVTLLWTFVVPRALGPAGLGLLVSGMSVSGVLAIVLGLGTRNFLVREMVVDPGAGRRLMGAAMVLRLVMAPVFALAVVVYASAAHLSHEASLVLYLTATSAFFVLLVEPIQAGFQAIERMKYLAYSDVLNKSAQSVFGIALVMAGFRVLGVAANMAAVAGVVVLLNAHWMRRFGGLQMRTTLRGLTAMVRGSVAYWAFGLFSMVYLWIDAIMLSLLTRPEVVGWYGAPTRLFQTLMFIPVLLSTAWLPRLVAAFHASPAALTQAARRPLELVLVLGTPLCAATAVAARPLVHLLYGPAYDKAVPVLVILGFCLPPMYLNIMLSQVLLAAKRQVVWTWVMLGATVMNPALNLVLIPATEAHYANGAIGAALSLLLTEVMMIGVGFAIVGRGVTDRRMVQRCGLTAVASAAMWAGAELARPIGELPAMVTGALVFVIVALAFRLVTRDELELLWARVSPRRA